MPTDEQHQALVNLADAARRALDAFQPAEASGPAAFLLKRTDDFMVEGGTEPIEVERLIRIISNSSLAAERLFNFVRQQRKIAQQGKELAEPLVTSSAALSYAARMRDSLKTMVELLTGDDSVSSITPDWMEMQQTAVPPESPSDIPLVIYHEPGCEAIAVKLGKVYMKIKQVRIDFPEGQELQRALQAIMDFITTEERKHG